MVNRSNVCALATLLLLMSACTSNNVREVAAPQVGMRMILPPAADFIDPPDNKSFLMATILRKVRPVYPAVLLTEGIQRQNVCAEIVIGEDGAVHNVTPLYEIPECPEREAETPQPFVQAVSEALIQWRFFAAAICTFPAGVEENDLCEGQGVKVEPIAIKLAYVFEFSNLDGETKVNVTQAK